MKTSLVNAKWFLTVLTAAGLACSAVRPAMAHGGGGMGGGMGHVGGSGASHSFSNSARTSSNFGSKNVTLSKFNSTSKSTQSVKFVGANTSLLNKNSLRSDPNSIVENTSLKTTTFSGTNNSITNVNQTLKANGGFGGSAGGTGTSSAGSAITRFPTGPIKGISGLAGGTSNTGTTIAGSGISRFPTGPIKGISGLTGGTSGTGTGTAGSGISRFPTGPIKGIGGLAGGSGTPGTGGSGTGGSGSGGSGSGGSGSGTGGSGTGGSGTGGMGSGNSGNSGNCHPYCGWGFWPLFSSFGGFGGYGGYGPGYSGGSYGGTYTVANSSAPTAPLAAVPANVVATTPAPAQGVDLQLVDVRLLDNGDAAKQIGPRYRVSFRNAGTSVVDHAFNVALVAADDANLTTNLPTIESRISSVATGEVANVDLRLPATAFDMGSDSHSEFAKLFVFVDSHGEVNDVNRDNNATGVDRTAVQPAT